MSCQRDSRESFLIRLWAEPVDDDEIVLRGSIQNVRTGHKAFFDALDFPVQLLRDSAERLSHSHHPNRPIA
jgi:hypothetical protein